MSMTAILLAASFWPFARGADAGVATVADAVPLAVEAGAPPPAADPVAAADAYAAFLSSPAANDPEMRLTALRRLADLRLEAAELALMDGYSPQRDLDEAVGLYRALLEDPSLHGAAPEWHDHWRYQLARAEAMAGRDSSAEEALRSLVVARPDSPLAPEAWFRVGEARFLVQDWIAAETAYRASLALDDAGAFSEQSHYKLGWTRFKQSLHELSFAPFATVIERRLATADLEELDRAGRELVDDSFRAMGIGFAALDGAATVGEWLDGRGAADPDWAWLSYERLGELHLEQERWTDAAAAFGAWAERTPRDGRAPAMQARAINALEAGGFTGEALAAMTVFAEHFSLQGDWWTGRDPRQHDEVRGLLKRSMDTLAAHHHAAFQQGAGSAAVAAGWYERWLAEFPTDPEAAERHFMLAELHYGDGALHAAAEAYWSAAYGYGEHPRAAEAGYAAVVTRRDLVLLGPGDAAAELELVEAALAFSDAFSTEPRAAEVELEAAERLLALGRLDGARAAGARVLARQEAPLPTRAAALLVNAHAAFELEEHAAAESDYLAWQVVTGTADAPPDAALAATVNERIAASIYRQGQAAAAHGDLDSAVNHFGRIYAAAPHSPAAATGQHDAAALLFNAAEWAAAANAYQVFLKRWPVHELASAAQVSLAAALVEQGDAARAAPALVAVATLPGESEEVRRVALWQAAELFHQVGDFRQAEQALRYYLDWFPTPADATMEARHRLAGLAAERKDFAAQHGWLESLVVAHRDAGEAATPRSRTLAAAASLELAMPAVERFAAQRLDPPLERSVPEKASRMRAALDGLGAAAAYGVAEVTTESAFRMAELYRGMATALLDSARPPGLDAETLEQYEMLLEEQAFPFEEDAIAIHEANAARARDGMYDQWVIGSFEALAELVPARWNRQEAGEHVVELLR